MLNSNLFRRWNELNKIVAILLISNVVLAVGFTIAAAKNATSHERVVLVPPNMTESAEVAWRNASGEYFKSWGLYVATMIGNITPSTVDFTVDSLSNLFAAEIYTSLREKLLAIAQDENLKRAGTVNYFSPVQAIYEPATAKTFIAGNLIIKYRNRMDTQPVVYEMQIEMLAGLPLIRNFSSYPGTDAHTLKWKNANRADAKEAELKEQQVIEAVSREEG